MNVEIPKNIKELTPEWLTRALSSYGAAVEINDVEVVDIFEGTSSRIRVRVDRNHAAIEAGLPEFLCVKANWTSHADFTLAAGLWAVEAQFYQHIRPGIDMLAPASYYSDYDAANGQGIILMEDLVQKQARFGSNVATLSVDQLASVLAEFASLHARWWGSSDLEKMSWLPLAQGTGTIDAEFINFQGGVPGMEALLAPPERAATLSAYGNNPAKMAKVVDALVVREAKSTAPRCLIHGDTHLGNSYWLGDRLGWLDWQLVRRGRPIREVAYVIGCSLGIDDRRRHERDLLSHYLDCLRGQGVDHGMSVDDAWLEYRHWPVWGFICWAVTQDGWQPKEVILETMARFGAAIDDLETYSLFDGC
ncbi:phosphotransferase [Spongiibacter sp. KMU-166]|uniref:Phosphotransferase n=1 Tax=Spongiibacter thalassae TaxID=2721624 RepID=A0ABX1GBN0_9GAMM|nr:phosphotransferase [Spongiibacter thalassae]NKI16380.1 phosphotransferase [Spongiibacter thalassae]